MLVEAPPSPQVQSPIWTRPEPGDAASGAPAEGDFASGARRSASEDRPRGDFATGMSTAVAPAAGTLGDFGTGLRLKAFPRARGDFATGRPEVRRAA